MIQALVQAEAKAAQLFDTAEQRHFFVGNQTEKELNERLYQLAEELFGIKKYWHKRIVRAGANTLLPYRENPENRMITADDILFVDFGPVFEEWEADYGRTYVIGADPIKLKLKEDTEKAWLMGQQWMHANWEQLTGAAVYAYTKNLAQELGWEFGHLHCGHLIGQFPHERIQGEEEKNYLHPNNTIRLAEADAQGRPRYWIYEMHLVNKSLQIGAFVERLVSKVPV